jgi:hypothetical protein
MSIGLFKGRVTVATRCGIGVRSSKQIPKGLETGTGDDCSRFRGRYRGMAKARPIPLMKIIAAP